MTRTGSIAIAALIVLLSAFSVTGVALAQADDTGIRERCEAQFSIATAAHQCEAAQREAAVGLAPITKFISDGQYLGQTMVLGACLDRAKDAFGTDFVEVAECYDRDVTAQCKGNATCLANSTIAGIRAHIAADTKP